MRAIDTYLQVIRVRCVENAPKEAVIGANLIDGVSAEILTWDAHRTVYTAYTVFRIRNLRSRTKVESIRNPAV